MEMIRALPRQIRDHETGEDFDVIGDDDMPRYSTRTQGETRERVDARAGGPSPTLPS